LSREGTLTDIARASDHLNISVLSHPVEKFFLCYPKKVAEPNLIKHDRQRINKQDLETG
jgi:hypothetical protein